MRAFAIATAALLLFSGSFNDSAGAQQVTALTNATLIDGSGAAPQSGVTIVMQGGRITAIGRDVKAPAGATVVDLTGKYVVPGIINGHGHVGPAPHERQVRQYALYGVTTTTSMASDPDAIAEYKARTRAGDIRGARVLTAMYRFTTMQAPGAGYDYRTPEAARGKVDEIAAKGADMLKVWIDPQGGKIPRLSREMVTAIVDQGRKHNLITGAHIVELADANMVIDEGVRILLHNVRDQEVGADFIARLKDRNITVISTLAREEGMFVYGSDGRGLHRQSVLHQVGAAGTHGRAHRQDPRSPGEDARPRARHPRVRDRQEEPQEDGRRRRALRLRHRFRRRSEPLLRAGLLRAPADGADGAGRAYADAGDPGVLAQQCGSLRHPERLRHAGARQGRRLLVLTKNPLDDILNMRALEAVYIGGRKFE